MNLDESYSLNAHVSRTVREILGQRFDIATAWTIIRSLWTSAILDSRQPPAWPRPQGQPLKMLESDCCFIDPWSPGAMETMERTYPELVALDTKYFRGRPRESA